ncbi:hypothetical protein APHAL10511_003303 [Amanita phalloides]|nr:hypothetical protein APHAL10511_003303 [Amanita phalloides]
MIAAFPGNSAYFKKVCMAATFIARWALASLRTGHALGCISQNSRRNARCFHSSPAVYEKKNEGIVLDDLFEEEEEGDDNGDLFKDEPAAPDAAASTLLSAAAPQPAQPPRRTKLSHEDRSERYAQLMAFVKPRLGRKPEIKQPQVRNSAWTNLVGLATTEGQLRELAELFPSWQASGRAFHPRFSELFVRRCEELSCPLLALDVFGNYAKHNLNLTLPSARHLLHALHVQYPIEKLIAASALYSIYGLTPIAQDLVSCSMLVAACFKHNSKESLKVAHALVPHLKRLLGQTEALPKISDPTPPPVKMADKPQAWLQWTLKKVDKALFVQTQSRAEWLRDWRMRSGHIIEPTRF